MVEHDGFFVATPQNHVSFGDPISLSEDDLGCIESPSQYLGSITILRRWLDP